jgi:predicted DNA-binding transcriptional regulator AlpA
MRVELENAMMAARNLAPDELPRLLGELETVRAVAWSRLTAPAAPANQQSRAELLDVDEAAARLGMSASYLYRNHGRFAFSRRVGRSLRFSAEGIDSYIQESGVLTLRRRGPIVTPAVQQEDKRK